MSAMVVRKPADNFLRELGVAFEDEGDYVGLASEHAELSSMTGRYQTRGSLHLDHPVQGPLCAWS
jgi:ribulose 1,5-bisphosphate synthetase/thiazole synthase